MILLVDSVTHRRSLVMPFRSSARKQKFIFCPSWSAEGVKEQVVNPFRLESVLIEVHVMPSGELNWN